MSLFLQLASFTVKIIAERDKINASHHEILNENEQLKQKNDLLQKELKSLKVRTLFFEGHVDFFVIMNVNRFSLFFKEIV